MSRLLSICFGSVLSSVFLSPPHVQVFQTLHATGQSSMVRDWVLLSLSNFTQRTPVAMAMWSLSCFFVSASTSQWISALYPFVLAFQKRTPRGSAESLSQPWKRAEIQSQRGTRCERLQDGGVVALQKRDCESRAKTGLAANSFGKNRSGDGVSPRARAWNVKSPVLNSPLRQAAARDQPHGLQRRRGRQPLLPGGHGFLPAPDWRGAGPQGVPVGLWDRGLPGQPLFPAAGLSPVDPPGQIALKRRRWNERRWTVGLKWTWVKRRLCTPSGSGEGDEVCTSSFPPDTDNLETYWITQRWKPERSGSWRFGLSLTSKDLISSSRNCGSVNNHRKHSCTLNISPAQHLHKSKEFNQTSSEHSDLISFSAVMVTVPLCYDVGFKWFLNIWSLNGVHVSFCDQSDHFQHTSSFWKTRRCLREFPVSSSQRDSWIILGVKCIRSERNSFGSSVMFEDTVYSVLRACRHLNLWKENYGFIRNIKL